MLQLKSEGVDLRSCGDTSRVPKGAETLTADPATVAWRHLVVSDGAGHRGGSPAHMVHGVQQRQPSHHVGDAEFVIAQAALVHRAHLLHAVQVGARHQAPDLRHVRHDEMHSHALVEHRLLRLR